jgi:hypothetical protein
MKQFIIIIIISFTPLLLLAQNPASDLLQQIEQLLQDEKDLNKKLPEGGPEAKESNERINRFEKLRQKATGIVSQINSQGKNAEELKRKQEALEAEIKKWEHSHELMSQYFNATSYRVKEEIIKRLAEDFPESELTKNLKKNLGKNPNSMIEETIIQLPAQQDLIKEKSNYSIFKTQNSIKVIEHQTAQTYDVQVPSSAKFVDIHHNSKTLLYLDKGDLYFKSFNSPNEKGKIFKRGVLDCYLTPDETKVIFFEAKGNRVSYYKIKTKEVKSIVSDKNSLRNDHRIHPASNNQYVVFYSPASFMVFEIAKSSADPKVNRKNANDRFDRSKPYFVQISADSFCVGVPDKMVRVYDLASGGNTKAKHIINEEYDHYYISGDKQWVFATKDKAFFKAKLGGPGGDRTLKFEQLPSIPNDHEIEILGQLPESGKFVFSDDGYPNSIFLYDLLQNKVEELNQAAKVHKVSISSDSKISVYCENGMLTVWAMQGSKLNPLSTSTLKLLGIE